MIDQLEGLGNKEKVFQSLLTSGLSQALAVSFKAKPGLNVDKTRCSIFFWLAFCLIYYIRVPISSFLVKGKLDENIQFFGVGFMIEGNETAKSADTIRLSQHLIWDLFLTLPA